MSRFCCCADCADCVDRAVTVSILRSSCGAKKILKDVERGTVGDDSDKSGDNKSCEVLGSSQDASC